MKEELKMISAYLVDWSSRKKWNLGNNLFWLFQWETLFHWLANAYHQLEIEFSLDELASSMTVDKSFMPSLRETWRSNNYLPDEVLKIKLFNEYQTHIQKLDISLT